MVIIGDGAAHFGANLNIPGTSLRVEFVTIFIGITFNDFIPSYRRKAFVQLEIRDRCAFIH
ncbi:hypothetical protein V3564_01440 [Bartonella sp. B12(2025)]